MTEREWLEKWRECDLERLRLRDAVRRMGLDPDELIEGEAEVVGRTKPDLRDPNLP